jgi:hypothetical protein
MKLARHVINRWWIFWPVVALYVALWSLPASVWFDSRSIQVSDSVVGEAPLVAEDRAVRWSFTGEYSATTRNAMTGEVARGCSGSEVLRYRGGQDRLQPSRAGSLLHRDVPDGALPAMGHSPCQDPVLDVEHLHGEGGSRRIK